MESIRERSTLGGRKEAAVPSSMGDALPDRKMASIAIVALMALSLFLLDVPTVSGLDDGPDHYPWEDEGAVLVGLYMNGTSTITEAIALAEEGDTVYIAPGLYRENVLVNKTVNLIGLFDGYIGVDGMGGPYSIRVASDGVGLKDIVVINASHGIDVVSCGGVRVTDCWCYICNIGLSLANCSGVVVEGCAFIRNGGAGMYLADTRYVSVKGTESSENGYGFGMYYAPYTTFTGCTAHYNRKAGFHIYWLSFGTKVLNCSCFSNGIGVHVLDVDDILVSGCHISMNGGAGIIMMTRDSIIEQCVLLGNSDNGLVIENSERTSVRNNTITGSQTTGATFSSSYRISIESNLFRDNGVGIELARGTAGSSIHGNDLLMSSSGQRAAINCGENDWSGNFWGDHLPDGDGIIEGTYEIPGDPPATDLDPNPCPFRFEGPVPRIFWTGEPAVNRTLVLNGSFSWPEGRNLEYRWDVRGGGIDGDFSGMEITIVPTRAGNLSVTLGVSNGSAEPVHYHLLVLIWNDMEGERPEGPGAARSAFLLAAVIGSSLALVGATMIRTYFKRPPPLAPRPCRRT